MLIKNANVQTETSWIKIWMVLRIQLTRNQWRHFPFWRCFWFCKLGHSKITINCHQALLMLSLTGSMTLALLVSTMEPKSLEPKSKVTVPKSISQHNNSSLESCWIAHISICSIFFQLEKWVSFEIMTSKTDLMAWWTHPTWRICECILVALDSISNPKRPYFSRVLSLGLSLNHLQNEFKGDSDVGEIVMLVTLWWWLIFSMYYIGRQHLRLVTNTFGLQHPSPTSMLPI